MPAAKSEFWDDRQTQKAFWVCLSICPFIPFSSTLYCIMSSHDGAGRIWRAYELVWHTVCYSHMNMFAYIPLAHSFMKKLITNKNNFGSRQLLLSYLSLFLHLYVHSLEQRTVDGGGGMPEGPRSRCLPSSVYAASKLKMRWNHLHLPPQQHSKPLSPIEIA